MTSNDKEVKVISSEDARSLALRGRVTIVGHGELVTDDDEVVQVTLVKWTQSKSNF